jgi:hypothetical protein
MPDPSDPGAWLDEAYSVFHGPVCDGCTDCAAKCAGSIQVWREEYEALRLAAAEAGLTWPPTPPASDWDPCPFLDERALCAVYSARPFICRAFGLVPWLPCSLDKTEPLPVAEALRLFADYASRPRKTLAAWSREY